MLRKLTSLILSFGLLFQQLGFAQVAVDLNIASHLSRMSSAMAVEKFRPVHLRYFSYDTLHNNFKLLVDKGDLKNPTQDEIRTSTQELLNYFLVGVTLHNESFWVNLRPDKEEEIIDDYLVQTDVGKVMLETDLQLKKDTAQFTSPQTPEGREYWERLYKKAEGLFGLDNVTIPTLTRPWIVPGEIIIREGKEGAYIYKAVLKVMLEQDYLQSTETRVQSTVDYAFKDPRSKALNEYSTQLIRELIIPKLTKEVNSSKRYAPIRQVYYSLILSRWFKNKFAGKTGGYASLINTQDLTGLTSKQSWSKTTYFKEYQKSFQQGEYNIKEPVYTPTGQVIRSYFSGGIQMAGSALTTDNGFSLKNDGLLPTKGSVEFTGDTAKGIIAAGPSTRFARSGSVQTDGDKGAGSPVVVERVIKEVEEDFLRAGAYLYGPGKNAIKGYCEGTIILSAAIQGLIKSQGKDVDNALAMRILIAAKQAVKYNLFNPSRLAIESYFRGEIDIDKAIEEITTSDTEITQDKAREILQEAKETALVQEAKADLQYVINDPELIVLGIATAKLNGRFVQIEKLAQLGRVLRDLFAIVQEQIVFNEKLINGTGWEEQERKKQDSTNVTDDSTQKTIRSAQNNIKKLELLKGLLVKIKNFIVNPLVSSLAQEIYNTLKEESRLEIYRNITDEDYHFRIFKKNGTLLDINAYYVSQKSDRPNLHRTFLNLHNAGFGPGYKITLNAGQAQEEIQATLLAAAGSSPMVDKELSSSSGLSIEEALKARRLGPAYIKEWLKQKIDKLLPVLLFSDKDMDEVHMLPGSRGFKIGELSVEELTVSKPTDSAYKIQIITSGVPFQITVGSDGIKIELDPTEIDKLGQADKVAERIDLLLHEVSPSKLVLLNKRTNQKEEFILSSQPIPTAATILVYEYRDRIREIIQRALGLSEAQAKKLAVGYMKTYAGYSGYLGPGIPSMSQAEARELEDRIIQAAETGKISPENAFIYEAWKKARRLFIKYELGENQGFWLSGAEDRLGGILEKEDETLQNTSKSQIIDLLPVAFMGTGYVFQLAPLWLLFDKYSVVPTKTATAASRFNARPAQASSGMHGEGAAGPSTRFARSGPAQTDENKGAGSPMLVVKDLTISWMDTEKPFITQYDSIFRKKLTGELPLALGEGNKDLKNKELPLVEDAISLKFSYYAGSKTALGDIILTDKDGERLLAETDIVLESSSPLNIIDVGAMFKDDPEGSAWSLSKILATYLQSRRKEPFHFSEEDFARFYLLPFVNVFIESFGRSPTGDEALDFYEIIKPNAGDGNIDGGDRIQFAKDEAIAFVNKRIKGIPAVFQKRVSEVQGWGTDNLKKNLQNWLQKLINKSPEQGITDRDKIIAIKLFSTYMRLFIEGEIKLAQFNDPNYDAVMNALGADLQITVAGYDLSKMSKEDIYRNIVLPSVTSIITARHFDNSQFTRKNWEKVVDILEGTINNTSAVASSALQAEGAAGSSTRFARSGPAQALVGDMENIKKEAGSPMAPGGIDFRSLPMTIKPMGSFEGLNMRLPQLSSSALLSFNISQEIEQLNQMVSSGILPSGERVQELVSACLQKGQLQAYQEEILTILAETCKLQEGECCESSDELKIALVAANAV